MRKLEVDQLIFVEMEMEMETIEGLDPPAPVEIGLILRYHSCLLKAESKSAEKLELYLLGPRSTGSWIIDSFHYLLR